MDNLIKILKRERLIRGEVKHGPLNLSTDLRNFIQEAIEEVIDGLNYIQFAFEKGQLNQTSYSKIDRALCDVAKMLLKEQMGKDEND